MSTLGKPDLSRIRQWVYSRSALYSALWLTSALGWVVSFIVNRRQGGTNAAVRYVGVAFSLATSLVATTPFPIPAFMTFPLLAMFSISAPPGIGYGGQVFFFALRTTLVLTVVAGVSSSLIKNHPLPDRPLRTLVIGQFVLVVVILGASGSLGFLGIVQNYGRPVSVHTLSVQARRKSTDTVFDGIVSCPLVEVSSAFVATEEGQLLQIDLESGRIVQKVKLPMPEPSEVGLGDFVKCPDYASACLTGKADISRISAERLSVVYPFHVGLRTDYGWGITDKSWTIKAEVDLPKGTIAGWVLVEGETPDQPDIFSVQTLGGEVRVGNESLVVYGPGVSTTIYTKGHIRWLRKGGGGGAWWLRLWKGACM